MHVCNHERRLPGISLAVVLPGYNVFKQLPPCHPGRGGVEERGEEGGKEERGAGGQREKLLAYTNKPQSHAWIKCHCVRVCVYKIYSQVKD